MMTAVVAVALLLTAIILTVAWQREAREKENAQRILDQFRDVFD